MNNQQENGAQTQERFEESSLLDQVLANTHGLSNSGSSLERDQLQVQVVTAKRFPRSIKSVLVEAETMATLTIETAEACFYSVPRAGKTISGPSIRLAEIFMSAWGHLDCGTRIKEIGKTTVTVEGFCWDMSANNKVRQETQRNITNKNGQRYNADMITTTINAAASIALRNAILRIIPRVYVDMVMQKARVVAVGDAKTLATRREAAVSYFMKSGVLAERIWAALDIKGIEDITLEHLATLTGFKTAIADKEATLDECFPPLTSAEDAKSLAERIKSKAKKEKDQVAAAIDDKTKADVAALASVALPATDAHGEIKDEPAAPVAMTDAEKAAIAEQEQAEAFDPEAATKEALIAQIKRHLVRLGKTKPSAETWAFSQASFAKKELVSGTESELRFVFRAVARMEVPK